MKISSGDTLQVLGHTYTIQLVSGLTDNDGDALLEGKTDCRKQIIYIEEGLSDSAKVQTVLHELFHAIDYGVGLGKLFTDEEREQKIELFAASLFSILVENGYLLFK